MATVRMPSSLQARKMRMAISPRFAQSTLRMGTTAFSDITDLPYWMRLAAANSPRPGGGGSLPEGAQVVEGDAAVLNDVVEYRHPFCLVGVHGRHHPERVQDVRLPSSIGLVDVFRGGDRDGGCDSRRFLVGHRRTSWRWHSRRGC